jgi:predicted 3-demethylubiquinone-9 3-methyltransferase (glyoxalase superfamily)
MQKITPFLWFNNQAEEAMNFYVSIFKNSKVEKVTRWGEGGPAPAGTVMTASFRLNGQEFIALNGGPQFTFTPAVSFVVHCDDQQEIDEYWAKLLEGGRPDRCGWLKDRFGLSWQVVPANIGELLQHKDPEKSRRVTAALMQMEKIDIARLEEAREQPAGV